MPTLYIFTGPQASGKTVVARKLVPERNIFDLPEGRELKADIGQLLAEGQDVVLCRHLRATRTTRFSSDAKARGYVVIRCTFRAPDAK